MESVLGATPHEFESRILRQCLTGHDVEGPHRSRWGHSTCVVAVLVAFIANIWDIPSSGKGARSRPHRATGADCAEPHHLTGYVTTVTGRRDPHDELAVLNDVDEEVIAALGCQQALRPEQL